MIRPLYRSVWLPAAVTATFLMVSLALMVGTSWRSLERFRPVHQHQAHLRRLQLAGSHVDQMLLESSRTQGPPRREWLSALRGDVDDLLSVGNYLDAGTPIRLQRVQRLLWAEDSDPNQVLIAVDADLGAVASAETSAHDALVTSVERDTRLELWISSAVTIALPLVAIALLFVLRRRFVLPLSNLSDLMSALGQPEYRVVPTSDLDPLLRPVFENYNHMASRLHELERQHLVRQQSLEQEVRVAAGTLLQQQRQLSTAQRLAAVGEVAAGLAHELRNPLAGIQMALSGIRRDLHDSECSSRLDLVINELKRTTRLLNDTLNLSRPAPEMPARVNLSALVSDLLTLLRYQVPLGITLVQNIPEHVRCRLPEGALRQALLNLVLNASQAIGEGRGEIMVSAEVDSGHLRLSVSDDGPGFPEELIETGIRAFVTLREGGTGLGLATVRRFAKDNGGELHLSNREAGGAQATLELPCEEAHG